MRARGNEEEQGLLAAYDLEQADIKLSEFNIGVLANLPTEVIFHILSFSTFEDLARAAGTSKDMKLLVDNTPAELIYEKETTQDDGSAKVVTKKIKGTYGQLIATVRERELARKRIVELDRTCCINTECGADGCASVVHIGGSAASTLECAGVISLARLVADVTMSGLGLFSTCGVLFAANAVAVECARRKVIANQGERRRLQHFLRKEPDISEPVRVEMLDEVNQPEPARPDDDQNQEGVNYEVLAHIR